MAESADPGANAVPTAYLSVLLFNVKNGKPPRITEGQRARESVSRMIDDQAAGIKAVLKSDPVKNAHNLFVLTSEQGETGAKLDMLKDSLGIKDEFLCNETVGIFQSSIEDDNFDTTFLGNNPRAAFAKVTVPLNGGNVIVLLVSYHGPHTGMTIKEKQNALRQLISDSDGMKRCLGCKAVIIGGDTNMPMKDAKQALPHVLFNPPEANFESLLDYVVFWSDADVKLEVAEGFPRVLKWADESFGKIPPTYSHVVLLPRPDPRNCPKVEPFDHPRLLYKFKVSRLTMNPVEELPGLLEGAQLNN